VLFNENNKRGDIKHSEMSRVSDDAMDTTPASVVAKVALVVDTNFLISNLSVLKDLHGLGPHYGHVIVVPWAVIQELDGMKKNADALVAKASRVATRWLYSLFASNDYYVVGQRIKDRLSGHEFDKGDDRVLECCLFYKEVKHVSTVLLSNDVNLCNKSLINGIPTVSYVNKVTTAQIIADNVRKLSDVNRFTDLGTPGDLTKPSMDLLSKRIAEQLDNSAAVSLEGIYNADEQLNPANNLRVNDLDDELLAYFDADVEMADLEDSNEVLDEGMNDQGNVHTGPISKIPLNSATNQLLPLNSLALSKHAAREARRRRNSLPEQHYDSVAQQPLSLSRGSREMKPSVRGNSATKLHPLLRSKHAHKRGQKSEHGVQSPPLGPMTLPISFDRLSGKPRIRNKRSPSRGATSPTSDSEKKDDDVIPPIAFEKLAKKKKKMSTLDVK
jgi:rRNA-processing protein FCF1